MYRYSRYRSNAVLQCAKAEGSTKKDPFYFRHCLGKNNSFDLNRLTTCLWAKPMHIGKNPRKTTLNWTSLVAAGRFKRNIHQKLWNLITNSVVSERLTAVQITKFVVKKHVEIWTFWIFLLLQVECVQSSSHIPQYILFRSHSGDRRYNINSRCDVKRH